MPEAAPQTASSPVPGRGPEAAPFRPRVAFAMTDNRLREALIPEPVLARLAAVAEIVDTEVLDGYDTDRARRVLAETEALITGWGAPPVTAALAEQHAPHLRLVAHAAGSVRKLFDPDCYRRGIVVTTAAQANAWPVAQWTLAMIILAGKRTLPRSRDLRERRRRVPYAAAGLGNFDLTVGVIGASRIGRLVLELLPTHGYRVLLADPTVTAQEASALGADLVPLEQLMADSDIVTLHAPILDSTIGMITAELLARMKDGATFINSARGVLVDHDGLRAEASDGRIDLVLDVTWPEPLPADDPLWDMPNVWLTPHVAGAQGRELVALGTAAVSEVECLAAGHPYHYPVDAALYAQMA